MMDELAGAPSIIVDVRRCRDCRHWSRDADSDWRATLSLESLPGEDPYGDAYNSRVHQAEAQYGQCKAITLVDRYDRLDADDLPAAFCRDASDYVADLYTLGDFGCTLWTANE